MRLTDWISKLLSKLIPPYNPTFNYNNKIAPVRKAEDYMKAYEQISWVHSCVKVISQTIAGTHWRLYQKKGKEYAEIEEHRALILFERPNAFQTRGELFQLTSINQELTGEAFWLLLREQNQKRIIGIIPLNPAYMEMEIEQGEPLHWIYRAGSKRIPLELEDVIQFKFPNPRNPYRGISPLKSISEVADADYYATKWNKNFFYNSAAPSGAFITDSILSEPEYTKLEKIIDKMYSGVDNAHKAILLQRGMKYEPIQFSHKDMDFLELRKLSRVEIASAFGVPLSKLGISEEVNRATAYVNDYTFAKNTIEPKLTLMREVLNNYYLPKFEDGLYFDYDSVIPRDREFELSKNKTYLEQGVLTINEVRQEMGYESVDWGDRPFNTQTGLQMGIEETEEKKIKQPAIDLDNVWEKTIKKTNDYEETIKGWVAARFENERKSVIQSLDEAFGDSLQAANLILTDPPQIERKMTEAEFMVRLERAMKDLFYKEEIKVWSRYYKDKMPEWLRQEYIDFSAMFGLRDDLGISESLLRDIMDRRSQRFATAINETTYEQLKKSLLDGFRDGEGLKGLKTRVTDVMTLNKRQRASTIARTELFSVLNESHQIALDQNGVEYKQWYTAQDEKVRIWHQNANGQTVKASESFIVNGERLKYPGDPSGSASNVINCRCVVVPAMS